MKHELKLFKERLSKLQWYQWIQTFSIPIFKLPIIFVADEYKNLSKPILVDGKSQPSIMILMMVVVYKPKTDTDRDFLYRKNRLQPITNISADTDSYRLSARTLHLVDVKVIHWLQFQSYQPVTPIIGDLKLKMDLCGNLFSPSLNIFFSMVLMVFF